MTNQNNAAQAQRDRYHILKTDPEAFQAVLSGAKTFEIRLNDRGYAVGDVLGLRETKHTGAEMQAGAPLEYTGRECQRFVSHVLTGYGLADGWCCLSFRLPHAAGESVPVAGQVVGWAAVPSRGKRAGRIYCTCDTREQIDAYIEQVHQSNDSLTLWARPLSFADAAPQPGTAAGEALFWYRPRSDGWYEGPIHNDRIEEARKRSGAWVPLVAAPQASGEDVRNAALEALEAAQRFIRNGIEFGYIRMPGADTPDPAHRTPGLIDTAISAFKTQADKDGCTCPSGDGSLRHPCPAHTQTNKGRA